ncbi:MAG: AAA family ATPase [Candidatus Limnocylindrales bacterium]
MPVITISRQFGSGGSRVAALVAERLHVEVVDQSLIAEVARRAALSPEDVQAEDERPSTLLDRLALSFSPLAVGLGVAWEPPYPDPAYDPRREVLQLTQDVVREVARSGNAVIVGRGGAFILHDRPDLLSVFLHADPAFRRKSVMEREGIDQAAADRRLREMDSNRAAYIKQVYGHDWLDLRLYDLAIDTGRLGLETAAAVILAAAEARGGTRP